LVERGQEEKKKRFFGGKKGEVIALPGRPKCLQRTERGRNISLTITLPLFANCDVQKNRKKDEEEKRRKSKLSEGVSSGKKREGTPKFSNERRQKKKGKRKGNSKKKRGGKPKKGGGSFLGREVARGNEKKIRLRRKGLKTDPKETRGWNWKKEKK